MLVQRQARLPVPPRILQREHAGFRRPKNLYVREDRILPHLRGLRLLLTAAEPASASSGSKRRRTRGGIDSEQPVSEDNVIACLRHSLPAHPRDHPYCPRTLRLMMAATLRMRM
jgi:hypothetical protein